MDGSAAAVAGLRCQGDVEAPQRSRGRGHEGIARGVRYRPAVLLSVLLDIRFDAAAVYAIKELEDGEAASDVAGRSRLALPAE
jgi:hypothetical protein